MVSYNDLPVPFVNQKHECRDKVIKEYILTRRPYLVSVRNYEKLKATNNVITKSNL